MVTSALNTNVSHIPVDTMVLHLLPSSPSEQCLISSLLSEHHSLQKSSHCAEIGDRDHSSENQLT